jgi:acyl-coenzyme A synthetase/AMP-(fatty) acid ligase
MLLGENPENYDLTSLQRVGYAGEPMDLATMVQIRGKFCSSVINTYGTTETGSWGGCTVMQAEDYANEDKIESVGRPAAGVDIRIIAPAGPVDGVLPAGEQGEVIISGPSVADSIWEQPEVARRIFDGCWWRSGDMGFIDEDGYLFLQGRIDDMIISGGINVLPTQVEEAVLSHPSVNECVVIGLPSDKWGQQITAFVVAETGLTAEELFKHVEDSGLASYKKPREFRFRDQLPRGNTGKVNRRLVRQQAEGTD